MPKAESPKHSKSPDDPTRPISPHRVAIPPTPAAAVRSDPIDGVRTSPKRSSDKDKENAPRESAGPASRAARAASEAPESRPEPSSPPTAAVRSAQPAAADRATSDAPASTTGQSPIDMEVFNQILELDEDDDDHSFSKTIVEEYFGQVDTTFDDMDAGIRAKDCPKLSSLGHFLKGSSAALGVWKVSETCAKIQYVGQGKSEKGERDPHWKAEEALVKLRSLKNQAQEEFVEAKEWLEKRLAGSA